MTTSPPADALPELPVAGWIDAGIARKMKRTRFDVASIYREKTYADDVAVVLKSDALSHAESLRAEVARLREALSEMVEFFEPNAWGSSTNRADALAGARAALKEQA